MQHNPNLPTEEIFTTPLKGKAEGGWSRPSRCPIQGQLIEDFSIDFKDGKAVSWRAAKNESLLGQMLSMDEGAAYLGELALASRRRVAGQPARASLFLQHAVRRERELSVALGRGFADCLGGL